MKPVSVGQKQIPAHGSPMMQIASLTMKAGCGEREIIGLLRSALILHALEKSRGNVVHAARLMKMHRNTLTRRLAMMGMSRVPGDLRRIYERQGRLALRKGREGYA